MSEPISDDRLAELAERLTTNFDCWIFSDVKRAEAVELVANAFLGRRKAEGERKKGWRLLGGLIPHGSPTREVISEVEADAAVSRWPGEYRKQWRYAAGEWQDLEIPSGASGVPGGGESCIAGAANPRERGAVVFPLPNPDKGNR